MTQTIEEKVIKASETVYEFEAELLQAIGNLELEPTNTNAAAVNIAQIKLTAAKKALANAQNERDQDLARFNSNDYKADVKRLGDIDKAADKQLEIVLAQVNEVTEAIGVLEDLAKETKTLRRKLGIEKAGFNEYPKFRRIWRLEGLIVQWLRDWKVYNTPPRQAAPVKHNYTPEQKKAMAERYKPADELNAKLARKWAKENPAGPDLD